MYIKSLKLKDFRNYEQLNIDNLPDGVIVIYGKNAQGKTNLIEAIHICANGKSFRTSSDTNTVRFGADGAYVKTEYITNKRTQYMEVLIGKDRKKSFKQSGIPVKSIKEMLGHLYVVVFSPEDIKTAKEAPGLRRGLLDGEISKIRPSYIDALKKYTTIVAQKNAVLRKRNMKGAAPLLEAYNEQLEGYIRIILKNRNSYVKKLNEYVAKTHDMISGGKEDVEILYRAGIREEDIAGQLAALLPREMEDMGVVSGPHRDDLDIRLNGKDVKQFASQGQLRTLMLAVKVACLKILEDSTGHVPVLLLDDVFSELDNTRKKNLLKSISGIQTFITTADHTDVERIPQAYNIEVASGKIKTAPSVKS